MIGRPGLIQSRNSQMSQQQRHGQLLHLLQQPTINLSDLRRLCWHGCPVEVRATCWKLLLGYTPTTNSRLSKTLFNKRAEYARILDAHYLGNKYLDKSILHQITIDIKRTSGGTFLLNDELRGRVIRVLYCWSIRRPASGYVQGLNDVIMPLFEVFLSDAIQASESNQPSPNITIDAGKLAQLAEPALDNVEADVFWCFSRLVDSIQDNYTASQVGIHRQVSRMQQICAVLDPDLVKHLQVNLEIEFVQFAFRWINCLLVRELKMGLIIRAWDTYLCEDGDLIISNSPPSTTVSGNSSKDSASSNISQSSFSTFHTFVCVALLLRFAPHIKAIHDFSDAMLFLQKLPTETWSVTEVELLLSEAYLYQAWYMRNKEFKK